MPEPIFILGGQQTDFAKTWSREGEDISDMIRVVTETTLAECELEASAIDTIHVGNAFAELQRKQAHLGAMVAQVVPDLWGVPAMRHEGACASSSLAMQDFSTYVTSTMIPSSCALRKEVSHGTHLDK